MGQIVAFFFALVFMFCPAAWALDIEEKTLSGSVSDVDWAGSRIAVSYFDPYSGHSDEVILIVTRDSKLTRGASSISFSDILQGDPVTVVYYPDDFSGFQIKRLSDGNRCGG